MFYSYLHIGNILFPYKKQIVSTVQTICFNILFTYINIISITRKDYLLL